MPVRAAGGEKWLSNAALINPLAAHLKALVHTPVLSLQRGVGFVAVAETFLMTVANFCPVQKEIDEETEISDCIVLLITWGRYLHSFCTCHKVQSFILGAGVLHPRVARHNCVFGRGEDPGAHPGTSGVHTSHTHHNDVTQK